jgi:hypothetical protein
MQGADKTGLQRIKEQIAFGLMQRIEDDRLKSAKDRHLTRV